MERMDNRKAGVSTEGQKELSNFLDPGIATKLNRGTPR